MNIMLSPEKVKKVFHPRNKLQAGKRKNYRNSKFSDHSWLKHTHTPPCSDVKALANSRKSTSSSEGVYKEQVLVAKYGK